jgi:serine/threonine-protein kinase
VALMADERRILELLEELLDTGRSPEDACSSCPELLPEVRERWEHFRGVQAEIEQLFPTPGATGPWPVDVPAALPAVPGYSVERVLGHGGMGIVYKAWHLRLNRAVAMKMLLSGAYAGRVERARFLHEAEAIAALQHPHVVQVFDAGEFEGRPYFTMELVEGGSLAERLAGVPLAADRAAALTRTLAGAVQAAHARGIVHRDLKPANVLLTPDGTPKVTDFGLARHVGGDDGMTAGGARVGTPSYMAPEQAAGSPGAAGPEADVYALGATLYEMLTGRPPFRGESAAETERQVIAAEPAAPRRLNTKVPRDLQTICLKCLRKDPRRRYASASALADDLGRFLSGEPIRARPTGPLEHAVKWVRRRPAAAAAAAATLLLAASVAGAALWWGWHRAAAARVAGAYLEQVAEHERAGNWAEARAALWRARAQVGVTGPADLSRRAGDAERDLRLVERLAAIRAGRAFATRANLNTADVDREYRDAFREAGVFTTDDAPAAAAARVRASPARGAMVAALDDWAFCFDDGPRRYWLLQVARGADPDAWRDQVRRLGNWNNPAALAGLAKTADVGRESVPLLLVLAGLLRANGGDFIGFHRRVQAAHPDDFWANFTLAEQLADRRDGEAISFYRAALAIQPRSVAVNVNLGNLLIDAGRRGQGMAYLKRSLELAPDSVMVRHNLAVALYNDGRVDEAMDSIRETIRMDPEFPYAHAVLGSALVKRGELAEGRAELRRALQLLPAEDPVRKFVGEAMEAAGRMEAGAATRPGAVR